MNLEPPSGGRVLTEKRELLGFGARAQLGRPGPALALQGGVRLSFIITLLALTAGCLAHGYEIDRAELERLAALPTAERGDEVRVTQQTSFASDISDQDVRAISGPVWWIELDDDEARPERRRRGHRHEAEGDDESPADEALAAIVVAAAIASTVAVTAGVTEGARFDGWLAAPATQPLLLIDASGGRRWRRLDTLSAADLSGVDRAVMPELDSELVRQRRAPLARRGFVYQLEFGTSQLQSSAADATLGAAGRAALGFMPQQDFGVLIGAAFAAASSAHALQATPGAAQVDDELNVEYRAFLQAEYWPLHTGRLHLGAFAEVGTGGALRDEPAAANRSVTGLTAGAGVALQLDWSTRLAATLRCGAFWLPSLEPRSAWLAPDGYHVASALTLGVSVY